MTTQTIGGTTQAAKLAIDGGTPVSEQKVPIVGVTISDQDIEAAVAVMRSGMLAMGKNCKALETRYAEATDAKHALTCANGTCALQLAYEALIEPGDEVLVPGWGYIATVSMILARGATPIFVDADPRTYNINVADAASKVTSRTTAIVGTHLYGNPVDIDAVEKLASDKGLSVIFDAAQAHLSRYKDRGVGAYGDASTYSFYATKNMTTGEGGMVTCNDADLERTISLKRSHGETEKYTHSVVGYNYRMTDVEAAIGLSQFDRLGEYTARRQSAADAITSALSGIDGLSAPTTTEGAEHVYHLYQVRIDPEAFKPVDGSVRNAFTAALNAEGVGTAIHYPKAVTRQPLFDTPGIEHLEVADRLAQTLFCVPVHHKLDDDQVRVIGEALAKVASAMRA